MTNPIITEMESLLAPVATKLVTQYVFPEIAKLEGKITNAQVALVIETITTALENVASSALAAVPPATA